MLRSSVAPQRLKRRPSKLAQAVSAPRLVAGVGVATAVPTVLGAISAPAADATVRTDSGVGQGSGKVVVLGYGSQGPLVSTAQQRLGGVDVDGSFGPRTLQRVRTYQQSNSLQVDGYVGPETWKSLGGFPAGGDDKSTTPAATPAPAPSTCSVQTIRYGSTGALVSNAQRALGGLEVDGSFGPATLARVKNFQAGKNLPVTGVIEARTWAALSTACAPTAESADDVTTSARSSTTPPVPSTPTPVVTNPDAAYRMPFAGGTTHQITQGPYGTFSHFNQYNRTGIDFAMPIGTPVVASRSGYVYDAGYTSAGGGTYVRIKDASGMCQVYMHLSGYQVTPGQRVAQGEQIALSGNSGNSSGPHLHFQLISCSTWLAGPLVDTVERGTDYTTGVAVTSRNYG